MNGVRKNWRGPRGIAVIVAIVVLAAVIAWIAMRPRPGPATREPAASAPAAGTAPAVPADHVDPANEGRLVKVIGPLSAGTPATDAELGIHADALLLFRHVEMLQWRERCTGESCDYAPVWSAQVIDSSHFRNADGHRNPGKLPFRQARFQAADMHLGAVALNTTPAIQGRRRVAFSVHVSDLPPNLAATFRDRNGSLFAGNDPAHARVDDLRVSYRIVPLGTVELTGVQRGNTLEVRSVVTR
jgi:hypothetical protein